MSQFKSVVMTEKHFWFINFFYHYIFQISVYFLFKNFNPPEKGHSLFLNNPLLNDEVVSGSLYLMVHAFYVSVVFSYFC